MTEPYYAALRGHADPARRVGWRGRLGQAARYEAAIAVIKTGETVLDLGCGLADLSRYLTASGVTVNYHGVDSDPTMVAAARTRHPGVQIDVRDYAYDPLPAADVVVAVGALVSGAALTERRVRLNAVRALARAAFSSARRVAALVLLRQEVVQSRVSLAVDPALGGIAASEVAWLARAVGATHVASRDVLATDRVIYLAKDAFTPPDADFAAAAVVGPFGGTADAIELGRFWLSAGRPGRAADVTATVDLAASAEGRWLRDAIVLAESTPS